LWVSPSWQSEGGHRYVVYAPCGGLDVDKKPLTACLLIAEAGGKGQSEIRRFGPMTRDLVELADWRQGQHVTQGARESTGVYWKPVWHIREGQFAVILVTAQPIKAVPGRKTALKKCQGSAELLQPGV
jgi:transposase